MSMTYVNTVAVGAGGAASIDFTSIPQTGTDLLVLISARVTDSDGTALLKFNASSSGYTDKRLYGTGTSTGSNQNVNGGSSIWAGQFDGSADTSSTFTNCSIYIPNYGSSSAKSVAIENVTERNGSYSVQEIMNGLWSGTGAITSLSITGVSNFVQYSKATLYLVTKGSGGATVS